MATASIAAALSVGKCRDGKNLRSFPDFAGKERFAFGEQRTSCPLACIV
jgi:hypothetical protein